MIILEDTITKIENGQEIVAVWEKNNGRSRHCWSKTTRIVNKAPQNKGKCKSFDRYRRKLMSNVRY